MKTRRFLAIIMAIVMVFAMCSCASADSGKTETKEETTAPESAENESVKEEAAETPEVTETEEVEEIAEEDVEKTTSDDKENILGLTESEMQELYTVIEENLQKDYLDVNNIKVEDFSIPTDDESWKYLSNYCTVVLFNPEISSEEAVKESNSTTSELSAENNTIMEIISCSFYNYLEKIDKVHEGMENVSMSESSLNLAKELITSNVFADTSTTE